jgi:hypothetical protein
MWRSRGIIFILYLEDPLQLRCIYLKVHLMRYARSHSALEPVLRAANDETRNEIRASHRIHQL